MSKQRRSTFVTVVAWIFIILNALGVVFLLFGMVAAAAVAADPQVVALMEEAAREAAAEGMEFEFPSLASVLFVMGLELLFTAAYFVVSVALLIRKNWGRIGSIVGAVLSIAYLLFDLGDSLLNPGPLMAAGDGYGALAGSMSSFVVILYLLFICFLGWVIAELTSGEVREEFGA